MDAAKLVKVEHERHENIKINQHWSCFQKYHADLTSNLFRAMRNRRRFTSNVLRRFFDAIPGKRRFGVYRFLPLFFFIGAAVEFSMINWTVGDTNFCK